MAHGSGIAKGAGMGFLSRPKKRTSWRRAWREGSRGTWRKARLVVLAMALLSGGSAYGLLAPLADGRAWSARAGGASDVANGVAHGIVNGMANGVANGVAEGGVRIGAAGGGMAQDAIALLARESSASPPVRRLAWALSLRQAEAWAREQWRRWWGGGTAREPGVSRGQGTRHDKADARPDGRSGAFVRGPARVIDGDSLEVAGVEVRLHGIDAPEYRQTCRDGAGRRYACGRRATAHMRQLVRGRQLTCRRVTTDRYGRMVAVCKAGGEDVGRRMVRDGWAVAFVRYSRAYVREERQARQARRGLWRGRFIPPALWRRMHRR